MPVPRLNISRYKPSENERKFHKLMDALFDMGYDVHNTQDIIDIIETKELNISPSDYPYGSFEEFKKHVLTGEFDFDIEKDIKFGTKEDHERLEKAVEKGKLWVTY